MTDFDELKQTKAQCLRDITEALPDYVNRLNSIGTREQSRNENKDLKMKEDKGFCLVKKSEVKMKEQHSPLSKTYFC